MPPTTRPAAVAAPMRLALTGGTRGEAKLRHRGIDALYRLRLPAAVYADGVLLAPGAHEEGITHNASVFYEEFSEKDGAPLFSLCTVPVHTENGIRFDLFAETLAAADCENRRCALDPDRAGCTGAYGNGRFYRLQPSKLFSHTA